MSSSTPTSPSNSSEGAITGIIVGIVGFIIATIVVPVVVVLVIIYKKRHRMKQLERMQMDILAIQGHGQSTGSHVETHIYGAATGNSRESELQDKQLTSISDPNPYSGNTLLGSSSYAHETRIRVPSHYLRELTRGKFVIKHEEITLLDSIGEGEFGVVYKARLSSHGRRHREVAIKTLKGDFDQLDVDKFVEESLKMGRFKHSHVMGLIGVCLDAGSAPFIIMPYMANGSLLKYLKKERDNIVILGKEDDDDDVKAVCKRLTVMCSQIASGMEYLAAEKYIHRDLAARNCMIDTHFLIKISDFGLAEDMFVRNYFRQGSAEEVVKLPVKWMAPENLSDGHFSEKSDVWSYGVTMWEVFSGGKAPYPGTNPLTLIKQLEEGERMPKPYNTACSDEMYAMMQKCWEKSPKDRPTFKELHLNLNQYIEHIAGYLEMGFNPFATEEVPTNEEGEEKDGVVQGSAEAKTTG